MITLKSLLCHLLDDAGYLVSSFGNNTICLKVHGYDSFLYLHMMHCSDDDFGVFASTHDRMHVVRIADINEPDGVSKILEYVGDRLPLSI